MVVPVPAHAVGVGWGGADPAEAEAVPVGTVGDGEALSEYQLPPVRAGQIAGGASALVGQEDQPVIADLAGQVGVVLLAAFYAAHGLMRPQEAGSRRRIRARQARRVRVFSW